MGLFNIGRNSNEDLPDKEKIIQLITEIAGILESDNVQNDSEIDGNSVSQEEYEAMQTSLGKENDELKVEIQRLKDEVASLQNDNEPAIEEQEDQPEAPILPVPAEVDLVATQLEAINDRISELARKDVIVQDLHSELQKYKVGLKKDIITPMLKSIIRCYDRIIECRNLALSGTDESTEAIFKQVGKEYTNLSLYISDMLYDYDVEIIEVSVGNTYEPKKHKAITTLSTDDESKHNTIAEIKKIGFEDVVLSRILRHCEVVVYKLEK